MKKELLKKLKSEENIKLLKNAGFSSIGVHSNHINIVYQKIVKENKELFTVYITLKFSRKVLRSNYRIHTTSHAYENKAYTLIAEGNLHLPFIYDSAKESSLEEVKEKLSDLNAQLISFLQIYK